MRVTHFGLVRNRSVDPQCGSWRKGSDWSASWEIVTCPRCYQRRHEIARMLAHPLASSSKGGVPLADKSKDVKAPDFLRELMQKGQESLKELSGLVQDLSKQDWSITKLREEGMKRALELRGRAGSFRSDAKEKSEVLQTKAVAFLGVKTRKQIVRQIEKLSKELGRLARRIDEMGRTPKGPRRPTALARRSKVDADEKKDPTQDK